MLYNINISNCNLQDGPCPLPFRAFFNFFQVFFSLASLLGHYVFFKAPSGSPACKVFSVASLLLFEDHFLCYRVHTSSLLFEDHFLCNRVHASLMSYKINMCACISTQEYECVGAEVCVCAWICASNSVAMEWSKKVHGFFFFKFYF